MNFTTEELQAALEALRRRPAHHYWPEQLDQVLANPMHARLVRIEASLRRKRYRPLPHRMHGLHTALSRPPAALDHKRAAAGDIDD